MAAITAACCSKAAEVTFLVRPRRAAQLADRGLVIRDPNGDFRTQVKTLTASDINDAFDVVLLACKAYDLDKAMDDVAPAVGAHTAILPVLNGINHITVLVDRFGAERVLGGVSLVRAELSSEGDIIRAEGSNLDKTVIGELRGEPSTRCRGIQSALRSGGVSTTISENIMAEMWAKFCAFAANGSISTLTRARAGEIAAVPAGPAFVESVFSECARIAAAEGYPPPREMGELVRAMYARAGSPYAPSILSDMERGRVTEGEYTIGDLVRRADRHGVEVPILRAALCNLQVHDARSSKETLGTQN